MCGLLATPGVSEISKLNATVVAMKLAAKAKKARAMAVNSYDRYMEYGVVSIEPFHVIM